MDPASQEGLKEMVTTAAQETSRVGGDGKAKGGCRVAEIIKDIPCPEMCRVEHSHVFNSTAFIQVKEKNKDTTNPSIQITPKCVYTCHKEYRVPETHI